MSNNQTADRRSIRASDGPAPTNLPGPSTPPNASALLQSSSSNLPAKKSNGERPSFHKSQAMVTINLKQNRKRKVFVVHKNFICHYSPYFDAAFNGNFEEARSQVLDLEDISPVTFEMFVDWIYTQDVRYPNGEPGHLILLWLLAERFLVSRLQNQTLELLHKEQVRLNKLPGDDLIRLLYDNTTETSSFRKYMVRICATGIGLDRLYSEDFPPEFLVDIIAYLRLHSTGTRSRRLTDEELTQYFVDNEQASACIVRTIGLQASTEVPLAVPAPAAPAPG